MGMRIVQCSFCGKKYKITGIVPAKTLKYRCKSCLHIIVVNNSETTKADAQLAHEKTTLPIPHGHESYGKHHWQTEISPPSLQATSTSSSRYFKSLRTKFNLPICIIFIGIIVLIYFYSGSRLREEAENEVFDKARLLLTTMEASRSFTSKVIKPALYEALPNRFITEGMSSSFGARNIFERIQKTYPQYYFKHAAPFPRNPINQADTFEMDVIAKFANDPELKEWQGYRIKGGNKEYSIMKPIVAEQRCMRCHSDPAIAPKELLERYGDENGFGRSVGEIIGTLTVSVPASVVIERAKRNTMIFIGMVVLFFCLLTLIVNVLFAKMVLKPIKKLAENANEISLGKLDTQINTSGGDEIATLAKAFNRMKQSIRIAFYKMTVN
jgi:HAMP domain-containing protein/DNA-directed RNA polymerase subunit RPC12/RpoP